MIAILPLLLAIPQLGAAGTYDENGNVLGSIPGTRAPGDIITSYSAGNNPNSGAARDGSTLLLISGYDGLASIYLVDEASGASIGSVPVLDSGDFGLGYDSTRGLYVTTHAGTDIVNTFNGSGTLLNSWSAPGPGPVGAAYDSLRDVYWVCDWQLNTVTAVDPVTGAAGTTLDLAAVGCTRPAGVAYDSDNDQVICGGRDQSSIFVLDAATGSLVRSFGAQDGGNNCQGLADSSSNNIWHTSWNSGTVFEVELGNSGSPGMTLAVSGTCPGVMSISVSGATALGPVAMVYGSAGSFTVLSGSCAGLTLDIAAPTLAGIFNADGSGDLNLAPNIPAGLCGSTLQAVDISACSASNSVVL
ncbi:MAG: YncE family protein [Planctomycetota bacterium]|jgi:hypothetical protein